jgi:hypothetical protein
MGLFGKKEASHNGLLNKIANPNPNGQGFLSKIANPGNGNGGLLGWIFNRNKTTPTPAQPTKFEEPTNKSDGSW